jgi:hypothetical protein
MIKEVPNQFGRTITPTYENQGGYNGGLILREYYAAKAMQSLIIVNEYDSTEDLVATSFRIADAMIKISTRTI